MSGSEQVERVDAEPLGQLLAVRAQALPDDVLQWLAHAGSVS